MPLINIRSIDASSESKDTIKAFIGKLPTKEVVVTPTRTKINDNEIKIVFEGNFINKNLIVYLDESLNKNFIYTNVAFQAPDKEINNETISNYKLAKIETTGVDKLSLYDIFLSSQNIIKESQIVPYYAYLSDQANSQLVTSITDLTSLKDFYDLLFEKKDFSASKIAGDTLYEKFYFSLHSLNAFQQYSARGDNKPEDYLLFFNKLEIPNPYLSNNNFISYYKNNKNAFFRNIYTFLSTATTTKVLPSYINDLLSTDINIVFDGSSIPINGQNIPIVFLNPISALPYDVSSFYSQQQKEFRNNFKNNIAAIFYGNSDSENPRTLESLQQITFQENKVENILNDNNTKFEPLFIKIKKYIGSSSTPIQEMYFSLGDSLSDSFALIDNQIFANKSYRYEVTLICVSYDLEYSYEKVEESIERQIIAYTCKSSLKQKIIEVPFFIDQISESNSGLSIPDVKFLTDSTNPNQVAITFNHFNATMEPNPIKASDEAFFNLIKNKNNKVLFDDEKIDFYEIYRIVQEPKTIKDFFIDPLATVPKFGTYVDKGLDNNKDYYYVFQSRNKRNKFSNPSYIYKVRLNYENGTFIPQISTYNLKTPDELLDMYRSNTISINKFFKIEPSFFQKNIVETGTPNTYRYSDIKFSGDSTGILAPRREIWNSSAGKYRVRITSKSTGKSVDVLLNFKYRLINKFK